MSNEVQVHNGEGFQIIQNAEGKFERKPIYQPFSSVQADSREEKIRLMNLIDGDLALPMNDHVGQKIDLVDVIFKPYDSVDEETGEITYGVLSYLFDHSGDVYVTSSKSVYHSLKNMFNVFGEPSYAEEDALVLEIEKKQGFNNKYTDVKLIG